jgi:hypothetical protein
LVISKTFNTGSLAVDGEKLILFSAIPTGALSGTKMWLAKGLKGHIDDVCLFEQALPDELIAEFGKKSPNGEEMGLINLLTFSQSQRNSSGVMELVFSPNNQRVFKDANGNVIHKEQKLLLDDLSARADKINTAPVSDRGQLTSLPFTWNYQLSELMINIKSQPREINKRTMYLTVRDVEDVNGNRLPSPVMWTIYADLNSVVWSEKRHRETLFDEESYRFNVDISNTTGMTRQFAINSLPDWLKASPAQGTLEAKEEKTITFTINAAALKMGTHHQMIYLTDDQELAEPLLLEISKESEPPYTDVDLRQYPFNMSLCGKVKVEEADKSVVIANENDLVYALFNNECVGIGHCTSNGELYLTIHGDDQMVRKQIRFQLWKASTGKVYNLTANRPVVFAHGYVYGCGTDEPVLLTAGSSEMQTITLNQGWNWISTCLEVSAPLATSLTAEHSWSEGDIIKNPASRQFATFSEQTDNFVGTLTQLHHSQMYMAYAAAENTMHIFGNKLSKDSMHVVLRGDGQWNALPCLFDQVTLLREALSDYYDHASVGDIIKSRNSFATFSADKRWVGDLSALTPGEGYLLRRMALGSVTIHFYPTANTNANAEAANAEAANANANANAEAATNMTMIATIVESQKSKVESPSPILKVYVGNELAGTFRPFVLSPFTSHPSLSSGAASPLSEASSLSEVSPLYFLTIQSDAVGESLRFVTGDGDILVPESGVIYYSADEHEGSLKAPVVLQATNANANVFKFLENDHIVIIRNGEKYDVTGKRLDNPR